jgi:capsular exopolysaccharide synthesis family protein
MSQHPYVLAVLRYWPVVVAAALLGGFAGWGFSQLATPIYRASASLYFAINFGNSGNDLNQGSTYTQGQMLSYGQLAESTVVLQPVIDKLDLGVSVKSLAESMEVTTPANTVILEVQVGDKDPEKAAEIADEIAASLTEVVDEIAPRSAEGEKTVTVRTIAPATPPSTPAAPNTRLNLVAGVLIALVLSILAIVIRRLLDTRVGPESIEEITGAPPLGLVSTNRAPADDYLLARDPMAAEAEDYRRLGTTFAHASGAVGSRPRGSAVKAEKSTSVVVTSSNPAEGVSTVAGNLALALAESGRRVVLVDADLRNPSVARMTGLPNEQGLATVLDGTAELATTLRREALPGVDVLTSGPVPTAASALLASPKMGELLAELKKKYDVIIIDTPNLGESADAALLAPLVGGALVVVDRTRAHVPGLIRTLKVLDQSGTRVFGLVMNRVHQRGHRVGHSPVTAESPVAAE